MNLEDAIFIIQLIIYLMIFLGMLYNLMTWGEFLELKHGFILFIISSFMFGFGFVTSIYGFSYGFYSLLFNLEIWLFPFMFLFLISSIFINLSKSFINKGGSYNAREQKY